jgi:hypothetical protein
MGRVWRATDVVLHRDVAIKELVPPPGLTPDERQEMRERSLREARAIARLNNVNVVRVFDVLRTDADPWIVMEYVASRSLHDILASDGPYPPARAAEIGLGVLNALRAAHRAGVVHRDVKPGNVLIGEDGRVVLTDFGLATVPGDPNVTRTGLVLGSPAYIAPERARDGTAGPGADLWGLGATLYAAVEGASPFARPSAIATLAALATENPPPARNAGPLKPVLNGLLRKDPAHRIDSDEAERLLLRALGRKSRISFPMSPTMRRPGLGRERPTPATPPVVPGLPQGSGATVSASAPVVPGPRPPVSPVSPGRPPATPPVTPGGGRPPVYAPGKASVGKAAPARLDATRVDTPKVVDNPTRVDHPKVVEPEALPSHAAWPAQPAPAAPAPAAVDAPTRSQAAASAAGAAVDADPRTGSGAATDADPQIDADPETETSASGVKSAVRGTATRTAAPETDAKPDVSAQPDPAVAAAAAVADVASAGTVADAGTDVDSSAGATSSATTSSATTGSATGTSAGTTKSRGKSGKGARKSAAAAAPTAAVGSTPTGAEPGTVDGAAGDATATASATAGPGEAKASEDAAPAAATETSIGAPDRSDTSAADAAADDSSRADTATPGSAGPTGAATGPTGPQSSTATTDAATGAASRHDGTGAAAAAAGIAAGAAGSDAPAGQTAGATGKSRGAGGSGKVKVGRGAARTNAPAARAPAQTSGAAAPAARTGTGPGNAAGGVARTTVIGAGATGGVASTGANRAGSPARPPWQGPPVRPASSGATGVPVLIAKLSERRTLLWIAAAASVVLVLALILPMVFADDDTRKPEAGAKTAGTTASAAVVPPVASAAAPTTTAAPSPTPSATPSAKPSTAPAGGVTLPAGWRIYKDPTGFSVPVPESWSVSREGTEVYFREGGNGGRLLIIGQTDEPKADPVKDWKQQESQRKGSYRNYHRISISAVSYFKEAADWQFTYTTPAGNPQRVTKRGFVVSKNQAYGIHWSTSPEDWDANRNELAVIYKGFKPAGG